MNSVLNLFLITWLYLYKINLSKFINLSKLTFWKQCRRRTYSTIDGGERGGTLTNNTNTNEQLGLTQRSQAATRRL